KNAKKYTAALSKFGITPIIPPDTVSVWSQYTIRLPDRVTRDRLKLALSTCGIPSMVYYPTPLHLQAAFAHLGIKKGALPISESTCEQVLSIPIHAYLKNDDVSLIIDAITEFMEKHI
ncbi:MAG: DegT/DnrJ/EryC1/StrS family aminotransferase, partial [Candidatus Fimivivens sp.]